MSITRQSPRAGCWPRVTGIDNVPIYEIMNPMGKKDRCKTVAYDVQGPDFNG